LYKVPQDINSDSSTQNVQIGGEFPKADKPPSPDVEKVVPKSLEPPSSGGTHSSPGFDTAPTSPAKALTKRLEGKLPLSPKPRLMLDIFSLLTPLWLTKSDVELNDLKAMVENTVLFFYPSDSSIAARAPQMLNGISTLSEEIILTNMKQSTSLTLGILKSLYLRANLDATGKGFAATCYDEEALNLVEDSAMMAERIIDMLPVDMS
jgi:hypothetical protein